MNPHEDKFEMFYNLLSSRTLMDDIIARTVFKSPIIVAYVLNKILKPYDELISDGYSTTQKDITNIFNRSVCFDVYFENNDYVIDLEFSKYPGDVSIKRARYYSSALDALDLPKNEPYPNMRTSYVIFIVNGPILPKQSFIERIEGFSTEKALPIKGNARYIVFVDTSQCDGSELGRMIHDLNCADPDHMQDPVLRKVMRDLKMSKEDETMLVKDMMRIFNEEFKSQIEHERNLALQEGMKEGKKEGMKEGEEKNAKSVLEMFDSGKSPEEIKAYLKTNFSK